MMSDPVLSYRKALREEFLASAPPALEMLNGQRPIDPVVLFSAWKGAGLLPILSAPEDRQLREQLIQHGKNPPIALTEMLVWPDDLAEAEEQEDQLFSLVALLGVASVVPSYQAQAEALLETWSLALALAELPEDIQACAQFLQDALNLDDEHLVNKLLVDYAADLPAMAPISQAVAQGITRAQSTLFPGGFWALYHRIQKKTVEVSSEIQQWFEQQLEQPSLVFAHTETDEALQLHDRLLLQREPEVCLLRRDNDLLLEVDGKDSQPILFNGQPLQELPPLVEGTRVWRVPVDFDALYIGNMPIRFTK